MLDAGQQVVQAVAEFVEQGGDFVVGQQRRLAADRRGEVAHQVGDRCLQVAGDGATTVARAVHPGTATLVGAGIEVEVEAADVLAVFLDLEQAHFRVPRLEIVQFADLDAVELLDDGEQAAEDFIHREVGAQGFLRHAVARFAQLLAIETGVPARQVRAALFGGIGLELLQVLLGERLAAHGEVTEEVQDLFRRLGHLGRQRQFGEAGVAQQLRQLLAQVEDFLHHRAVVVLPGVRALVGGAGAVGGVDLFAQGAVFGVGHYGEVAGEFQGDQPAFQPLGFGGVLHLRLGRIGQAGQRRFVGDVLGPRLGGVEQLVGEAAGQLGQARLDFRVALLLLRRQIDTGQAEVAQGVFEDGLLRHFEIGGSRAGGQRLVGLEQLAVLPQLGPVGGQQRQAAFIGLAQFGAVAHRVEVAHRTPGGTEAVVQFVHRQDQAVPRGSSVLFGEDARNCRAVVGKNLLDGRLHMFRTDGGERRQIVRLQKGIRAHGDNLG
ncbi:hypothetical protein D3C81_732710 [compost metagenome]